MNREIIYYWSENMWISQFTLLLLSYTWISAIKCRVCGCYHNVLRDIHILPTLYNDPGYLHVIHRILDSCTS